MRIEVICDKDNLLGKGIHCIGSKFEGIDKIDCFSGFCNNGFAFACKRFKNHEDICDTVSLIFGINFFGLAWSTWNTSFLNELLICFVNADHRIQRIIWALIDIKHVFHFGYKFSTCFGYTPFGGEPCCRLYIPRPQV